MASTHLLNRETVISSAAKKRRRQPGSSRQMFYSGIGTQRNDGRFLKAGVNMTFPAPRAIWVARFPGELDPSCAMQNETPRKPTSISDQQLVGLRRIF